MSSNHDANQTAFYFDFNQQEQKNVKKEFTDLHSCDDADNDSRKYIQLQIFKIRFFFSFL